jgi:hypothetical protein
VATYVNATAICLAASKTAGRFYLGTDIPTNANRLNYDGDLWVHDLHTNAASIYIGPWQLSTDTGTLTLNDGVNTFTVVTTLQGVDNSIDVTQIGGEIHLVNNVLRLNTAQSDIAVAPTKNAIIEVQRGSENNTAIRWNEGDNRWEMTNDGLVFYPVSLLDITGKVPLSALPDAVVNALEYQGVWNAASGTYPTSPDAGYFWIVSGAGTILGVEYISGDWMVYDGQWWAKVDNSTQVNTVAGRKGNVVLNAADVGLSNVLNARQLTALPSATATAIPRWAAGGEALTDSPITISDTGTIAINDYRAKIVVSRANLGLGSDQSISWNEPARTFVFSAPITAPNLPSTYSSVNFISGSVPNFLKMNGAQAIRLDVVYRDMLNMNVRFDSIMACIAAGNQISWTVQSSGELGDTSGIAPYFTLNGTQVTLGFDVADGDWTVAVTPHVMAFNGASVSFTTFGV